MLWNYRSEVSRAYSLPGALEVTGLMPNGEPARHRRNSGTAPPRDGSRVGEPASAQSDTSDHGDDVNGVFPRVTSAVGAR
jgi:hypothetical protein